MQLGTPFCIASEELKRELICLLSETIDIQFYYLTYQVKWTAEQLMEEHIIFGDFFDLDDQSHGRVYRPITDQNKIRQTLEEFYMRMNFGNTKVWQFFTLLLYLISVLLQVLRVLNVGYNITA